MTIPLTEKELTNRERLRQSKPNVWGKVIRHTPEWVSRKSAAMIQLQYSYECNFRCSHCSIAGLRRNGSSRRLDIPTVKRVCDEADAYGLAQVGISGGEPTMFKDLPELVKAIGPDRFYLQIDTNAWLMTSEFANRLKVIGIDKVQISIDGMDAKAHDAFRRKRGSYDRCIAAIRHVQQAELSVQICTVVNHERAQSDELPEFMRLMQSLNAPTVIMFAHPSGEWSGRTDLMCTEQDVSRINELTERFGGRHYLAPHYGVDYGCHAVKRLLTITGYGDVLPCPWMMQSLGNVFEEPLADIIGRGMVRFGDYSPTCRLLKLNGIDS